MSRDDGDIEEIEERLRRHYHSSFGLPPDPAQIKKQVAQSMDLPTTSERFQHVRQVLGQTGLSRRVGPGPLLATCAAMVVVALLAGLLLFARPGGPHRLTSGVTGTATATAVAVTSTATAVPTIPLATAVPATCGHTPPNPRPAGTPVDHSVAVGRQVTVKGITLTIDRAYADATQTVVTYHMQASSVSEAQLADPVLIDSQGSRYSLVSGLSGGYFPVKDSGEIIFAPLPQAELGSPQHLTLFTQQVEFLQTASPTPPVQTFLNGPWQVSFNLTPEAGTSVALSNSPLTRNGVTVQPLRVGVAPLGGGLDFMAGGARVIVRVSGLPPGAFLVNVATFGTGQFNLYAGATEDLAGSTGPYCGGGRGILVLVLPNGQQIYPDFVLPLGLAVPGTGDPLQTVGPGGTAELEALFFQPIPTVSSITLYMDQVEVRTAVEAPPKPISGPWQFHLLPGR